MTSLTHTPSGTFVACHAPGALKRLADIVEGTEARCTTDPCEVKDMASVQTPLLCVDTHGFASAPMIGRPGGTTIDISNLSGHADIVALNVCYQSEEFARLWARQFNAIAVIHATGTAQQFTGSRALMRALCAPETWGDPAAVLRQIVDRSPLNATAHRGAGWRITRGTRAR